MPSHPLRSSSLSLQHAPTGALGNNAGDSLVSGNPMTMGASAVQRSVGGGSHLPWSRSQSVGSMPVPPASAWVPPLQASLPVIEEPNHLPSASRDSAVCWVSWMCGAFHFLSNIGHNIIKKKICVQPTLLMPCLHWFLRGIFRMIKIPKSCGRNLWLPELWSITGSCISYCTSAHLPIWLFQFPCCSFHIFTYSIIQSLTAAVLLQCLCTTLDMKKGKFEGVSHASAADLQCCSSALLMRISSICVYWVSMGNVHSSLHLCCHCTR